MRPLLGLPTNRKNYFSFRFQNAWKVIFFKNSIASLGPLAVYLIPQRCVLFLSVVVFSICGLNKKEWMCMKENFSSCSEIQSYCGVIQISVGIQDLSSVYTNLLMLHFVHMDLNWKLAHCFPQSILWVRISKIIQLFHL